MSGTLYLVATPIGNLEDITLRALRVLKEVDLVAAEDTRHSRKLFSHYGIATPLTSYYEHNDGGKGGATSGRPARGEIGSPHFRCRQPGHFRSGLSPGPPLPR